MKRKVSINVAPFQRRLGDKGALEFAARIGADAVDFDLYTARWDYRNEASVYARSDGEIRAYFEDIAAHAPRGDRHSSRVEAKNPALLSNRDGYLLELTGWTQGSQAS